MTPSIPGAKATTRPAFFDCRATSQNSNKLAWSPEELPEPQMHTSLIRLAGSHRQAECCTGIERDGGPKAASDAFGLVCKRARAGKLKYTAGIHRRHYELAQVVSSAAVDCDVRLFHGLFETSER